jgi:hypothetical protein
MLRFSAALVFGGLCVALFLTGAGATGQDKDTPKVAKGKLPKNWSKIGLTDEQKQNIFKVQEEYQPKIDALKAQLKKLVAEEMEKMVSALTDEQKERLRKLAVPETKDKKTTEAKETKKDK